MSMSGEFGNPLRKFKLVFLGEQSGEFLLPVLCDAVSSSLVLTAFSDPFQQKEKQQAGERRREGTKGRGRGNRRKGKKVGTRRGVGTWHWFSWISWSGKDGRCDVLFRLRPRPFYLPFPVVLRMRWWISLETCLSIPISCLRGLNWSLKWIREDGFCPTPVIDQLRVCFFFFPLYHGFPQ